MHLCGLSLCRPWGRWRLQWQSRRMQLKLIPTVKSKKLSSSMQGRRRRSGTTATTHRTLLDTTRKQKSRCWRCLCTPLQQLHRTACLRCRSCRYELRIAELRVALGASAAAPEPEPEPASDELRNPQLNATENDLKKGKKKADKEKVNRSKSKDRSRRRSSSDRRSSSRRRSSGGRKRQNSSTWKGDEDPTARLTDAEWRLMWGLHSQVAIIAVVFITLSYLFASHYSNVFGSTRLSIDGVISYPRSQEAPQLVISEEEHRRRLGEALVAASSDAVLRREDVEKRLRCAIPIATSAWA